MTAVTITKLYDLLSVKVGKETAEDLIMFIEHKIRLDLENKIQLSTREDISKLDKKVNETKVDLLRWLFFFWITLALLILGLYFKK